MTARHEQTDWTTETDTEILTALAKNLVLSPTIIAENIDKSRVTVSRRLDSLRAGGLVEKVERGRYKITWDGELYLRGKHGEDIPEGGFPPEELGKSPEELKQLLHEKGEQELQDEYDLTDEQMEFIKKMEPVDNE